MLAFITPAFWIMMIQLNATTLNVVPGSQAAEPRRRQRHRRNTQSTPSRPTTQGFEISGGVAQ